MSCSERTTEILEALVGFDTTSRNSNLALVEWVEDYLDRLGVVHERIADPTGNQGQPVGDDRARRDGPATSSPATPTWCRSTARHWSNDPFRLAERDGRLYGRGAADMKGFVACCLAAVPDMLAAPPARPIHLAFSYDEEVGCVGVRGMIAHLERAGVKPAACFVGEPTGMNVVIGHKGKRSFRVTVRGRTCHSSLAPDGRQRGRICGAR